MTCFGRTAHESPAFALVGNVPPFNHRVRFWRSKVALPFPAIRFLASSSQGGGPGLLEKIVRDNFRKEATTFLSLCLSVWASELIRNLIDSPSSSCSVTPGSANVVGELPVGRGGFGSRHACGGPIGKVLSCQSTFFRVCVSPSLVLLLL